MDRIHCPAVYRVTGSLNQSHALKDLRPGLNQVKGYIGFKSRSFITDQTVEAASSGRRRRGLALTTARHGQAWRLARV
jgi:hypothetical protein